METRAMKVLSLPDLGEGLQEATIVEWHVRAGDTVEVDQPLAAVETDKAMVEIPAPYAGTIEHLFGNEGDTVAVNAPLVGFAGAASDSGVVVGELPAPEQVTATADPRPVPARQGRPTAGAVRATPAVRALARDLGIDLGTVQGRGPEGVVRAEDVLAASRRTRVEDGASAEGVVASQDGAWEPLQGLRKTMARRMARAGREVVPVTIMDDADLGEWPPSTAPLPRLVRAIVAACRAEPALNAWYDGAAERRQVHEDVHLGIAVDTHDGLIQPVLRDCGALAGMALAEALDRLVRSTRDRTVPPGDLQGHTVALTNFGSIGGRHATPVVMPPAVAILGAGRAAECPVVHEGAIVARRRLPLSLTFDHRAVTGGEAARFLAAVIADLQQP